MTGTRLNPDFADALRAELVAQVTSEAAARRQGAARLRGARPRWLLRGGAAAVVLTAAGTAYALSSSAPGGTEVIAQGVSRTSEHTGASVVELGPRPLAAAAVEIEFTCLSAGTYSMPAGQDLTCDSDAVARAATQPAKVKGTYPLGAGQHEVSIGASPDAHWRITTRYVTTRTTGWGVNANGQTYGVPNDNGEPDLQAVFASNGRIGYVYTRDLNSAGGPPPTDATAVAPDRDPLKEGVRIPVYEPDGQTPIGDFLVGGR